MQNFVWIVTSNHEEKNPVQGAFFEREQAEEFVRQSFKSNCEELGDDYSYYAYKVESGFEDEYWKVEKFAVCVS